MASINNNGIVLPSTIDGESNISCDIINLPDLSAPGAAFIDVNNNLNSVVLTNGQILVGSTGSNPIANTLTAGSNITITNTAGNIKIASTGSSNTFADITLTNPTNQIEFTGPANDMTINAPTFGQTTTLLIPDPGAVSANFLLNAGGWTSLGTMNLNNGSSTSTTTIGNALATNVINGTTNINSSINEPVNINIGTSTGTVTVGNSLSTTAIIGATNINTGSSSATTTIGNASSTNAINGTTNINSSINEPVNINTGTSTGATTIGNTADGGEVKILSSANGITLSIAASDCFCAFGSGATSITLTGTTNINTTASNGATTIGNTSNEVELIGNIILLNGAATTIDGTSSVNINSSLSGTVTIGDSGTVTIVTGSGELIAGNSTGICIFGNQNASNTIAGAPLNLNINSGNIVAGGGTSAGTITIGGSSNATQILTLGGATPNTIMRGATIYIGQTATGAGGDGVVVGGGSGGSTVDIGSSSATVAILGTTNINTSGTETTSIGASGTTTTVLGTLNLNASGTATNNIGASGTTTAHLGTVSFVGTTTLNTTGSATSNIGNSSNNTSAAQVTINAATITFGNATTSYVPAALNYYEAASTVTATWTGPWASTPTGNVNFTMIGNMVFVELVATSPTSNSSTNTLIVDDSIIPVRFTPARTCNIATVIINSSTTTSAATLQFNVNGNISISLTNGAVYTSGVSVGWTESLYGSYSIV